MRILDLFSGLGGWSEAFVRHGHEVMRVDNNPRFSDVPHTVIRDVLEFDPGPFDIVLASPPCQAFSLAAGGHHLHNGREPISEVGRQAVRLVERTLYLIELIQPTYWWMENPNGGMVNFVPDDIPRVQVTYCQYGETRMKLTNLWGRWPKTWIPRPKCKNGAPCHESAPRGAKTGTQGIKGSALRAKVPYELSNEIREATDRDLDREPEMARLF